MKVLGNTSAVNQPLAELYDLSAQKKNQRERITSTMVTAIVLPIDVVRPVCVISSAGTVPTIAIGSTNRMIPLLAAPYTLVGSRPIDWSV